jgi:rubrerythrin
MTNEADKPPLNVAAPKSVAELIAMALAMEREAAARYDELAAQMAKHGNHELADLFEGLGTEERKHEAHIERWLAPGQPEPPATNFAWRSPESVDREEAEDAGGAFLMTPHRALRIAVHNEERAFQFFSMIAATVEDPGIRAKAEALAKEELEHVARLRLERLRARRAESESAAQGTARRGPRSVRSHAALLARASAIEQEAATTFETLARHMSDIGAKTIRELFRKLAEEEHAFVAAIGERIQARGLTSEPVALDIRPVSAKTSGDALGLALGEAEAAFDFYTAAAELSADQAMMEEAQHLAAHALDLLKRLRGHLSDRVSSDE